jgi:hypothetical protein
MKTYLQELRGQVRGNARLRRRLDRLKARVQWLEEWIGAMVIHADKLGYGDDQIVKNAAREIGWSRLPPEDVERIKAVIRGMMM